MQVSHTAVDRCTFRWRNVGSAAEGIGHPRGGTPDG